MALRAVHAFGKVFDVVVTRSGEGVRVKVTPDSGPSVDSLTPKGATVTVVF
jgi:hypothetical protein